MTGLDAALDAMATVIRVAADEGSDAAIEWLADWMNSHDAVMPEDVAHYERWAKRAGEAAGASNVSNEDEVK